MITIFTDGSSRGNPGPGGWGSVVVAGTISDPKTAHVIEVGGREDLTTNNRMEIKASIEGLEASLKFHDGQVKVNSDSSYVINSITKWVYGWARKDWITSQKEPVSNRDLWEDLMRVSEMVEKQSGTKVLWNYVGGHVGIAGNERCDEIATSFADNDPTLLFSGSFADYSIKNILDTNGVVAKKVKSKAHSKATAYSYVSSVNGTIETHSNWKDCEARVKGMKNARFKKSISSADEAEIMRSFS